MLGRCKQMTEQKVESALMTGRQSRNNVPAEGEVEGGEDSRNWKGVEDDDTEGEKDA